MKYELIHFCEFDRWAAQSYCAIHQEDSAKNLGDITKVDETKLEPFNVIVGGSPCQDFSVAGNQKGSKWTCNDCEAEYNPLTVHWSYREYCPDCGSENLNKTRSSLLVEWLRIIRTNKPDWGIYENVKNIVGKQFKETTFKLFTDELQEYGYNTYWKVLNAKDYGVPQNRERVYLFLVKQELDNGMFKFPKPFDNGIRLKDILEDGVNEKYYISPEKTEKLVRQIKDPSILFLGDNKIIEAGKINSSQDGVVVSDKGISKTHTAGNNNCPKIIQVGNYMPTKTRENPNQGRVYNTNGISPALNCNGGGGREPRIVLPCITPDRVNKQQNGRRFKTDGEPSFTLTGQDRHGVLLAKKIAIDKSYNDPRKRDIANCITARDRGVSNLRQEGTAVVYVKEATKKGYAIADIGDSINLKQPNCCSAN